MKETDYSSIGQFANGLNSTIESLADQGGQSQGVTRLVLFDFYDYLLVIHFFWEEAHTPYLYFCTNLTHQWKVMNISYL